MKNPTFKEQFDKVVPAYNKDKLKVMSSSFCFIGHILNNDSDWNESSNFVTVNACLKKQANSFYTYEEIKKLENNFIKKWLDLNPRLNTYSDKFEEAMYEAMVSTLFMLWKLHESKGEIVEDYKFEKRCA